MNPSDSHPHAEELDNPLDAPASEPEHTLARRAPDILEAHFEEVPTVPTTALARIEPRIPEPPPAPPAPPAEPPPPPPPGPPSNNNASSSPGSAARVSLGGGALRTALHFVMMAVPKGKKEEDRAVLHMRTDDKGRLELGATDGYRTHVAYVALPKGTALPAHTVTAASARVIAGALDFAHKHGDYSAVHVESKNLWHLAYGAPDEMTLEWMPAVIQAEDWRAPSFKGKASAAFNHEAKLVQQGLTLKGAEGARVVRDEVDESGLRHLVIADEYGEEVARAVIASVGNHEDAKKSEDPRQGKIPGTAPAPLSEKAPASEGLSAVTFTAGGKSVTLDKDFAARMRRLIEESEAKEGTSPSPARDVASALLRDAKGARQLQEVWKGIAATESLTAEDREVLAGAWIERVHGLGFKWKQVKGWVLRPECSEKDFPAATSGYVKKASKETAVQAPAAETSSAPAAEEAPASETTADGQKLVKLGRKKKAPPAEPGEPSAQPAKKRRSKPTRAVEDPSDKRPRRVSVAAEHFEAHRRGFAAGTAMPLRKQWKQDGDVYLVTLAPGPTLDTIVSYAKERGIALTVEVASE